MKDSQRYIKIVEWSDADQCYVGSAPELFYGGCHGDDEIEVFRELCEIVEEVVTAMVEDGDPFPPGTAGREVAGPFPRVRRAEKPRIVG